jgi:hypothetical protein
MPPHRPALHPPHVARFWMHGVFLPDTTISSESVLSACSVARRWQLESLNQIDDLPARVENIIGRELVHQSRSKASAARTHHPTAPSSYDNTRLPIDLESGGFHEVHLDIPTSCVAVGLVYQLASQQRELRSAGPAPPLAASSPPLLVKLRQQNILFLRAASVPAFSGRRIKIRSPHPTRPRTLHIPPEIARWLILLLPPLPLSHHRHQHPDFSANRNVLHSHLHQWHRHNPPSIHIYLQRRTHPILLRPHHQPPPLLHLW